MFIDTWNRDEMNISGGSKFVAGPLPKHAESPEGARYSGLLECPLTDRIAKVFPGGGSSNTGFNSTFSPTILPCKGGNSSTTVCEHAIVSAETCFAVAQRKVGKTVVLKTSTGASNTTASGCEFYCFVKRMSAYFHNLMTF